VQFRLEKHINDSFTNFFVQLKVYDNNICIRKLFCFLDYSHKNYSQTYIIIYFILVFLFNIDYNGVL
jgi:hypothetical protein